jgi:cytidylate kinase
MSIITVSRQLGSGGDEIAAAIADALGFRLVNRESLFEEVGLPASDPRLEEECGRSVGVAERIVRLKQMSDSLKSLSEAIAEVGRRGRAVIVGGGAHLVLRGHPQALHVRIVAPLDVRVAAVAKEASLSEEEARRRVLAADERREFFYREIYGVEWGDPSSFHLTLDSASTGKEGCVAVIIALAQARGVAPHWQFQHTPPGGRQENPG